MAFFLPATYASAQSDERYDAIETSQASLFKKVEKKYRFRVSLADKAGSKFSIKHPEAFLSKRALDRRKRLGLKVDAHDLPVSERYLSALSGAGFPVITTSRWNNTVVVESADSLADATLRSLPFVKEARMVWVGPDSVSLKSNSRPKLLDSIPDVQLPEHYGYAQRQVEMIGADSLHLAGYKGGGVVVAVIDGGFLNTDIVRPLSGVRVLGTHNFVDPSASVYDDTNHGTMVLSSMGVNLPNFMQGTSPEASFYLFKSEDGRTEQLIEMDFWAAAVEMADSVGADIVNSSLGYTKFDYPWMNYKYASLDGKQTLISRTASLAASRGLLVVNSAGNSGNDAWKKIGFPADATDILTVGAVSAKEINASFSSIGNTADGRVKPDVMAMGQKSALIYENGDYIFANGTSFSAPILCGGVACLIGAFPNKRPTEIIEAVKKTASQADTPDNIFGYGIANVWQAFKLLKK